MKYKTTMLASFAVCVFLYAPNMAHAKFLSADPVGFKEGGPDYFNRYSYAINDPINLLDPDGRQATIAVEGNDVNVHFNVHRRAQFPDRMQVSGGRSSPFPSSVTVQDRTANSVLGAMSSSGSINLTMSMSTTLAANGDTAAPNSVDLQPLPGFGTSQVNPDTNVLFMFENANGQVLAHELPHTAGVPDAYNRGDLSPLPGFDSNNLMADPDGRQLTDGQIMQMIQDPRNTVTCTDSELC